MKLGLVVRRLGTQGGTERFVHGLAGHMVSAGHEVEIWCAAVDSPVPGVRTHAVRPAGRGRLGKMWAMQRAVSRIPRGGLDHLLGFVRAPGVDLWRAGGGCHASWLQSWGGWSLADQVELRLDRETARSARLIVANSRMAGRDLQEHYGVEPSRLRLVHNGVDLERFSPDREPMPGLPENRAVFLGSGFVRKGLEAAMRAVATVPDLHLVVFGGDPRPQRFQRLAAQLDLKDRLHLWGPVADPARGLVGARVMILPTRYDPFANSCLEAMACGVPVLTTSLNGAAELLPEPWMQVESPGDVAGLSGALARVLRQPSLGEACLSVARTRPASAAFDTFLRVVGEL